jgi:hypothetical protein
MSFQERASTNENSYVISENDYANLEREFEQVKNSLLNPQTKPSNVVGLGIGSKWRNGEPTGEPAYMVFVTHNIDERISQIADRMGSAPTEIVEVGAVLAAGRSASPTLRQALVQSRGGILPRIAEPGYDYPEMAMPEPPFGIQPAIYQRAAFEQEQARLLNRIRPVQGGFSVGYKRGPITTTGTIGTCVYDVLPGYDVNPPKQGVGRPQSFYILSTNHVLANCNDAVPGEAILQPSAADGGQEMSDTVARLARFVPIDFEPFLPREQHNNFVDAAIAEGDFTQLDRQIFWSGVLRGWRRRGMVKLGTVVQKTGRSTGFTSGRIIALNATFDVSYGTGKVARFRDQIVTTNMVASGDSGALVITPDKVAVGMVFATSPVITLCNHIEYIRSMLRVEIAEQAL